MRTLAVVGGLVVACLIGLGVWALIARELGLTKMIAPPEPPPSPKPEPIADSPKQPRRKT